MKVHVLLADRGTSNTQTATLNLLNIGWQVTQLRPMPLPPGIRVSAPAMVTPAQSVAVFLEADPQECNRMLTLAVELVDGDGAAVRVPAISGESPPIRVTHSVMVPTPPGVPTGFPGHANLLIELAQGVPLKPGAYRWQVKVDGRTEDSWSAPFYVKSPPAASASDS